MINKFIKSMLFVPGHKTNFLNKLDQTISDAVVLDLEDSVPLNKKLLARKNLEKIKSSFLKIIFCQN